MSIILSDQVFLSDFPQELVLKSVELKNSSIIAAALVGSDSAKAKLNESSAKLNYDYHRYNRLWLKVEEYLCSLLLQLDELNYKISNTNKSTLKLRRQALNLIGLIEACFSFRAEILNCLVQSNNNVAENILDNYPPEIKRLHSDFKKFSLNFKSLLSKIIFKNKIEEKEESLSEYCAYIRNCSEKFYSTELRLMSDDYVHLSAFELQHKEDIKMQRKYIIYFPSEKECYLSNAKYIFSLANATRSNVITLNVRNISLDNLSYAKSCKQLQLDGITAYNYLISKNVSPKDITFYTKGMQNYWLIKLVEKLVKKQQEIKVFYKNENFSVFRKILALLFFGYVNIDKLYKNLPDSARAFTLVDIRNHSLAPDKIYHNESVKEWDEHGLGLSGGGVRAGGKYFRKTQKAKQKRNSAVKAAVVKGAIVKAAKMKSTKKK